MELEIEERIRTFSGLRGGCGVVVLLESGVLVMVQVGEAMIAVPESARMRIEAGMEALRIRGVLATTVDGDVVEEAESLLIRCVEASASRSESGGNRE